MRNRILPLKIPDRMIIISEPICILVNFYLNMSECINYSKIFAIGPTFPKLPWHQILINDAIKSSFRSHFLSTLLANF